MLSYLIRRLLLMIVTLFGVSVAIFSFGATSFFTAFSTGFFAFAASGFFDGIYVSLAD